MNIFLLALQFLTVAPVRVKKIMPRQMPRAVIYFPLVGLLIGLALSAVNCFLVFAHIDTFVSNIILAVVLIIMTGGLHLDGLSDTFDGLFSGKDRPDMLKIMRDPHAGAMGILALISVLLLKISFLSLIGPEMKNAALILMCVLSRWSMALSLSLFSYAREEGKAKIFMDGMDGRIFILATLMALMITFVIFGSGGPVILVATAGFAYLANTWIKGKIGGITGDTIGAVSELSEIIILLGIIILEKIA